MFIFKTKTRLMFSLRTISSKFINKHVKETKTPPAVFRLFYISYPQKSGVYFGLGCTPHSA